MRLWFVLAAAVAALAPASIAAAQVPRGDAVRPSETSVDNCVKVVERAMAAAGVGAHATDRSVNPVVSDLIVKGVVRAPESLVADRSGLKPGDTLTTATLRRSARRVLDLPVASCGWVSQTPQDNGRASVVLGIDERPRFPKTWANWGEIGGRAAILREVIVPFGGVLSSGDRVDLELGWKVERPRAALRLTTPAPGLLPGLAVVEASWNRQAFETIDASGPHVVHEERRAVRAGFEDWATERVHWHVDATWDNVDRREFGALGFGIDTRWFSDRFALRLESASWRAINDSGRFQTGSLTAHWRQDPGAVPRGFSAEAGVVNASNATPLMLWPGADVGASRQAFLRAHKLFDDGVVTSEVFGRRLGFGSVSYELHIAKTKFGDAGLVGFIDSAKAWHGINANDSPVHTDVGLGARFHALSFGTVRLDFGYGLRDGKTAISAGFSRPWPRR